MKGMTVRVPQLFIAFLMLNPAVCNASAMAAAQVTVGTAPARISLLVPGVRRYLRYSAKDEVRSTIDIWTRTVSQEVQDGERRLHITQIWDRTVPPTSIVRQDAWFDARTFAPITHVRRVQRDEVTSIGGYRFVPGAIVGMDELAGNERKGFREAAPEAPFNFEYDMELLQTLPWRKGYVADIVFYDPGREPPAHYLFKQAGEVTLLGPDGRPIECWLITADYNTGKIVNRFWIDKRTQVILHEEAEKDGTLYVKTLLTSEQAEPAHD